MFTIKDVRCHHEEQSIEGEGFGKKAKEPEQPWQTLSRLVHIFKDSNVESWWNLSGPILGTLMDEADYDLQSQYACLIFHLYHIVPRLGSANTSPVNSPRWRSFMTDDFSPLEYSWNWDTRQSGPRIRYSVELVGVNAGASIDPYNQQSTIELCDQLRRDLPGTDWTLFNIMRTAFYDPNATITNMTPEENDRSSPSSLFLAFELGRHIATKAYFLPVKAEQRGISRVVVLDEAIELLRKSGYPCVGYEQLKRFMVTEQGSMLQVILVAIDCIGSEESRFKIYLRSPHTSFASVCEMMTLGSTLDSLPAMARTNLKDLWRLTLGLSPNFSEADNLRPNRHETAGILYYFDIKLRGSSLQPKLYIPVKHYATNDASAAHGLGMYLKSRGQDTYFPNYMRALQRTCTHRSLDADSGYQTYIGTSVQRDGSLSLCSYISGEAYYTNRMCT
ncbi:aromatic prenyltransferase [Byssothecium circinans]|uniref:Aromatic prenyltransferase n=1 Tax=Byssothecium circinans TaxID=147558 RepID=A0A6A5TAA7_9PLEO|nr:aromatic prenyltransferase [Byssothecium circinans]